MKYIEGYWRDATLADAIKNPPMVARFRYEESGKWKTELLLGFDRDGSEITWSGQSMRVHYCQVYDAPEPKYVPFTWEDRTQLRGRWVTDIDGHEFLLVTLERRSSGSIEINGIDADSALEMWTFCDTGEPVGKQV